MQTADLQPVAWSGVKNAVGDGQARSIIQGKWWFEVGYRYAGHGWQNASYKIRSLESRRTHLSENKEPGQIHMDLRLGDKALPPQPDDYPLPPAIVHAGDSSHGAISYRCPYPGTDYDVKAVYQWVPPDGADAGPKTQAPSHWKLTDYTVTPHPASFCGA